MTNVRGLGVAFHQYAGEYRRAAARLHSAVRESGPECTGVARRVIESWRRHVEFGLENVVVVGSHVVGRGWQAPLRDRSLEALWPAARALMQQLGCGGDAQVAAVDRGLRELAIAIESDAGLSRSGGDSPTRPPRWADFHEAMTAASVALDEATLDLVELARRSAPRSLAV